MFWLELTIFNVEPDTNFKLNWGYVRSCTRQWRRSLTPRTSTIRHQEHHRLVYAGIQSKYPVFQGFVLLAAPIFAKEGPTPPHSRLNSIFRICYVTATMIITQDAICSLEWNTESQSSHPAPRSKHLEVDSFSVPPHALCTVHNLC